MKTALILGAKSDIAKAIAYQLAAENTNLILAAREAEELKALAADLRIRYGIQTDCRDFDALSISTHEDFYNNLPTHPDLVFCVFGYMGNQLTAQTDRNEMFRILNTNYIAAISILEVVAADMGKRKNGNIIGISSVAGDRGRASNYYYGSSKAGFTAYLSGLRNRLHKSNVHVMTVKPGFVRTAMTAELKLPPFITAQPDQIAKHILSSLKRKRNEIYSLWMWRYIMYIIRNIPESIFKKMKL